MNQGHVVAVFRKSGDSPSKGARITQLLMTRLDVSGSETNRIHLGREDSTNPILTQDNFRHLIEFVGTSPVVTHDGYNWKRFLRQEFASVPTGQVKSFLALTVDLSEWSQQHFPRQRKEIDAICKRMKIEPPSEATGMERETAMLRQLIPHLPKVPSEPLQTMPSAQSVAPIRKQQKPPQSLRLRLRRAWGILLGNDR